MSEQQHEHGPECAECGTSDGPMYLHSRCHTGSPTWASMQGNVLTITCAECDKEIARFEVAGVAQR